jgi:hypothetical protein
LGTNPPGRVLNVLPLVMRHESSWEKRTRAPAREWHPAGRRPGGSGPAPVGAILPVPLPPGPDGRDPDSTASSSIGNPRGSTSLTDRCRRLTAVSDSGRRRRSQRRVTAVTQPRRRLRPHGLHMDMQPDENPNRSMVTIETTVESRAGSDRARQKMALYSAVLSRWPRAGKPLGPNRGRADDLIVF